MTDTKSEIAKVLGEIRHETDRLKKNVGRQEHWFVSLAGLLGGFAAYFGIGFFLAFGILSGLRAFKWLFG